MRKALEIFCKNYDKDIKELSKYKKLEKELDIDLITLFKILSSKVYYLLYRNIRFTEQPKLQYNKETKKFYILVHSNYIELSLSDYGKTWALTKKELEKQKWKH